MGFYIFFILVNLCNVSGAVEEYRGVYDQSFNSPKSDNKYCRCLENQWHLHRLKYEMNLHLNREIRHTNLQIQKNVSTHKCALSQHLHEVEVSERSMKEFI